MTRHKGASRKTAVTAEDLKQISDCYRIIQAIHAGLNQESSQKLPLMAASATVKACWAELSGSVVLGGWSYPGDRVTLDGLHPGADRSGRPVEKTYMAKIGR